SAIAGYGVEILLRRMRPHILHIGRERDRPAPGERALGDVDVEPVQLRSDAGVIRGLVRGLSPGRCRGGDRAGEQRGECAAGHHLGFLPLLGKTTILRGRRTEISHTWTSASSGSAIWASTWPGASSRRAIG